MSNYRIGGILVMLLGIVLYFLTGAEWETFAGVIAGAGFGLFIYSFLEKTKRRI